MSDTLEKPPEAVSPPPPPPPPASPPPSPPPPAEEAKAPAWSDLVKAIPDKDIRGFAERFTSLDELAKGGLDLRRAASNRDGVIKVPGEKATVEEIAQFRKSLGVPETPAAYAIEIPKGALERETDKQWFGSLMEIAHKRHVSREALDEMTKSFFEYGANTVRQMEEAMKVTKEAETVKLRSQWGADFERNAGLAERAHEHYSSPAWDEYAKALGLTNDPNYMRLMARIGAEVAPHNPIIATSPTEAADNMTALKEEHARRSKEGTLNDDDFQRRWREGWARQTRQ
jgi:hypothetical protein